MNTPYMESVLYTDKNGCTKVKVTLHEQKKCILQKLISYDSYLSILSNSTSEKPSYYRLGKLPKGYVDGSFGTDGSYKIAIFYKGAIRCLNYYGAKHVRIPYPDLYFLFTVKKDGTVFDKRCFSKDKSNRICLYPFGNVSSSHSICMGNIVRKVKDPYELDLFIEDFFMGITNDDYFKEKKGKFNAQIDLINALDGRNVFPCRYLIRTPSEVSSYISNYLK